MRGALQQAEANLRYTTILSPTDGTVVAKNVAVGQSVAAFGGQQVVWRLAGHDRLEPVAVKVGISDYANTQLVEGRLQEGDLLVTGAIVADSGAKGAARPPRPAGQAGGGRPR
jgi:hypothetical protein